MRTGVPDGIFVQSSFFIFACGALMMKIKHGKLILDIKLVLPFNAFNVLSISEATVTSCFILSYVTDVLMLVMF